MRSLRSLVRCTDRSRASRFVICSRHSSSLAILSSVPTVTVLSEGRKNRPRRSESPTFGSFEGMKKAFDLLTSYQELVGEYEELATGYTALEADMHTLRQTLERYLNDP